jgi:crooked neck
MFAKFEVQRLELPGARKILGTGVGICPKEALFKGYIDLEVEVDIFCIFFISHTRTHGQ